jgi:hypothetical protein
MVLVIDEGRGEISSFVIHMRSLYLKKDIAAFEKQIVCKVSELMKGGNKESLKQLYCYVDPIYQLLYFEIKTKTAPISCEMQKMLELAALPLYKMSEEIRGNYLLKLGDLLAKSHL